MRQNYRTDERAILYQIAVISQIYPRQIQTWIPYV